MPYQRITLATLRARLADRVDTSPYWTTADLDQALNDALRYWNGLTGYWRGRTSITIPANDPYASVPDSLTQRTSVTIANQPLTATSLFALSMTRPNWRKETTAGGGEIPTRPILWAPVSLMMFVIWPAATTDQTASLDGVVQTPVLSAAGDFLDADDSVISVLVGYAMHLLAFKAPAGLLEQTAQYKDEFLAAAADRNAALRRTDWYKRLQRVSRQYKEQPVKRAAPDDSGGPGGL